MEQLNVICRYFGCFIRNESFFEIFPNFKSNQLMDYDNDCSVKVTRCTCQTELH